jgi:cell division protein FtsA
MQNKILTALDIGTTKIVALVGVIEQGNTLTVIGHGIVPSAGLKRGVVVNIEQTTKAIHQAVELAQKMAGQSVQSVIAGIAGSHVQSLNSHGVVPIRQQEVQHADIHRVIEAAKAVAIPADQAILHILPQEFYIDHQDGIQDPIGMSGVRLEAKVHVVTGAVSAIANITKCIEQCHLKVQDLVLEPLASSVSVLSEDEKRLGTCLVDIGGGTTDITVFVGGSVRYSAVIPVAGNQVTNDVAIAFRTPHTAAETLKIEHGSVLTVSEGSSIEVPAIADDRPAQSIDPDQLVLVLHARYEELMQMVAKELNRSQWLPMLASGIVLTGGGSMVRELDQLASQVFQCPVRVAVPELLTGLPDSFAHPKYATAVGLLRYGYQRAIEQPVSSGIPSNTILAKLKRWFHQYF